MSAAAPAPRSPAREPPLSKDGEQLLSVRAEVMRKRSRTSQFADTMGHVLSHPVFFLSLLGTHLVWVALNLPICPWEPWDPYPFVFLATFASVEAPFFALLVLMHQRREARIDELREELDLQVSLFLEREVTVILRMLKQVHAELGIATAEPAGTLEHLEKELHPDRLLRHLRRRLAETERVDAAG
jgi:uncharacterized membrane protein